MFIIGVHVQSFWSANCMFWHYGIICFFSERKRWDVLYWGDIIEQIVQELFEKHEDKTGHPVHQGRTERGTDTHITRYSLYIKKSLRYTTDCQIKTPEIYSQACTWTYDKRIVKKTSAPSKTKHQNPGKEKSWMGTDSPLDITFRYVYSRIFLIVSCSASYL